MEETALVNGKIQYTTTCNKESINAHITWANWIQNGDIV